MAGTACNCAGIVSEYAAALATRTGRKVSGVDLAAGGLVTQDVLEDLLGSTTARDAVRRADVVLVTIGANDLYPELNEWKQSSCPASCYDPATEQMGVRLSRILDTIDSLRPDSDGPVLVTNYWNVFTDGNVARRTGGSRRSPGATRSPRPPTRPSAAPCRTTTPSASTWWPRSRDPPATSTRPPCWPTTATIPTRPAS